MEHVQRIKTFEAFSQGNVYYNSHGNWASFREIREIEVERGNYLEEDFDEWQEKYDIEDSDEVLWVTPNKKMAYRYLFNADMWDELVDMDLRKIERLCKKEYGDCDLYEVTDKEGFIIPESDDGEEGYIFVWRKK